MQLSASAVVADGFRFSLTTIGGAVTLMLVVVPMTIGLIGAGGSAMRLLRGVLRA